MSDTKQPPQWEYSNYRASLKKGGEFYCVLSDAKMQVIEPGKKDELLRILNTHHALLEALERSIATINMLYGWEPIEAEKDKAAWQGPRKEMPEGFTELSNAAGVPPIVMKNFLNGLNETIATARA